MNSKIFTLLLLSLVSIGMVNAQKIKIKKNIASVDDKPYVKVEKESGSMSIYSLDGDDEIIFLKLYDPTPNDKSKPDSYFIIRFIDFDKEVEIGGKSRKGILKMFFKAKVINDNGKIDEERMKKFISKYGSDISKNKIYIN